MNKNLTWKLALIVGILLAFLLGIFGIPKSFAKQGRPASMTERIHLVLDLRGGTHLILQVQVNDAVNVDSDNALETLKEQLRTKKINYAEATKPDPKNNPDRIVLKGVPPESRSDLLTIVQERLPEYEATPGPESTPVVRMTPQMLADLKNNAITEAN